MVQSDANTRATAKLIAEALAWAPQIDDSARAEEAYWDVVRLLHKRGGEVEFDAAKALAQSTDFHDRRATDALAQLCCDSDPDVRDWASFGLAELCSLDYPELRQALSSLLADENPEIRGQALIGLAMRGDRTCLEALEAELTGPFHGIWAVKAAGALGDPCLVPALLSCREKIEAERHRDYFIDDADKALDACRNSTPLEM